MDELCRLHTENVSSKECVRHAEKPWRQGPKGGVKEGSGGQWGGGGHATRRWVKRKVGEKGAIVSSMFCRCSSG